MRPRAAPQLLALVAALGALGLTRPAAALEPPAPPARVSVLTMGPGDHPFTRFGHDALLLEWDGAGATGARDIVYNFGTFELAGVSGALDFMTGQFRYWLSASTLKRTLRTYGAAQRSLVAQELALSEGERSELATLLEQNALPEHRYYDYDYYRDNCATRLRDVLDRVLGGALQRSAPGPARLTFRQHTLRLVAGTPWLYGGLDFALGSGTDRPATRWEELFLPQELHDALAQASRQQGGISVPLVRSERRLLQAQRARVPRDPPETRPTFAAAGALLGLAGFGLARGAARRRALLAGYVTVLAALGLACGLLGCALASFWFSRHWAAQANYSLLLCPPWAFLLAIYALRLFRRKPGAERGLALCLASLTLLGAVALALTFVRTGGYENQRLPLAFLPLWSGLLAGGWRAGRSRAVPGATQ